MADPWIIRDGHRGDVGLIFSSWLKGQRAAMQQVEMDAGYFDAWRLVVAALIERSKVVTAVSEDDEERRSRGEKSIIYGWACGERSVLHAVYVKKPYRRAGIARALVQGLELDVLERYVTHAPLPKYRQLAESHGFTYAPHLAAIRALTAGER